MLPSSRPSDIIKAQQEILSSPSNIPLSLDGKAPEPQVPIPPPPPPPQLSSVQEGSSSEDKSPQTSDPVVEPVKKDVHGQNTLYFGQSDLLNQKRMLKKVDRKAEYNPVTLARKELFEDEYAKQGDTPPEYLPLHIVKATIVSQNISADLMTLNLNGIDQLTDYLFPLLHGGGTTPVGYYLKLKKMLLVGCINLTDQGLIWIARLFPDMQTIEINACRKVTEKGLHYIFMGCRNLHNVSAMAINASLIPDSIMQTKIPTGSIQWAGCPLISQGKEYYTTHHGTGLDSYFEPHKRKLLILRDKSVKEEIMPHLTKNKTMGNFLFHYQESFQVAGSDPSSSPSLFNMFEIAANSPLQDTLVSEGTIVMIPYSLAGDSNHLIKTADRIADTISAVVIKCPDVMFLLVEMSAIGSKDSISGLIKARLQYLADSLDTTTYKLYTRTWQLEYLDFKGQQGLGWGIASCEALESLVNPEENRMMTVFVTKENFNMNVTAALSRCSMDIKKHVPWVHCEWSKEIETIIQKIPKTALRSQTSIFHENDIEAKSLNHKRYSFPRLGKLINLLQNWGEALYFWHEHRSMCVTDIHAYENLVIKFLSCKPPDKMKINFLGGEISCWKLSTLEDLIQHEKLEVKALDIVALLKHQGMLLPIPEQHIDDGTSGCPVFVRTDDVPDGHQILNTLWPEPCPKQRILQTNRCYNFLPSLPPGLIPKLLRTLVKVYKPLYIWKTGFLLRQGPVDIKASLLNCSGTHLDKTTVLLLSARVVDLRMSTSSTDSLDAQPATHEPKNVMFSCLRQVMALVDFVCQKTKVYAFITLPCPECAEFTTEGILDTRQTYHFSYYTALAGKHKSCKKHETVTASFLTNVYDEKGEGLGPVIPLHNYPYHIAVSAILEQTIKAERHRPMDPAERCFYCGGCLDAPCLHCLMCSLCTKEFAKFAKIVEPGQIMSRSFKLQLLKDGELADNERIISNTKGCVYYYKKGYCIQLHQAMVPFYMDEIFITILKGACFNLTMTFGTDKKLKYNGHAATVVDQDGHVHQNEKLRSRDTNLINIRLEPVEIGKRVRVVICLRGLQVHSEEVDGWQMKLEIISEKAGIYIIHVPGMKASWYTNDHYFTVGSTQVVENQHTTHSAVIMEKTSEGYLTLDSLYSKSANRVHAPEWAFMMFQVPCGFETLIKSNLAQGNHQDNELKREGMDLQNLICPCTTLYFPSVWHGKQILLRDKVEKCLFTDGKWNFSLTSLLMLPSTLTRDDFTTCSQTMFTGNFKLHPLCQFRGDVNTVMTSGPTVPQIKTIECFHCLHMLDNEGFEFDKCHLDEAANLGCNILWAWTLMLLRLQHDKLPEMNLLTKGIEGIEHQTNEEIYKGFRQVIQAMNHALFLSLGRDFDFKSSLNDQACEQWKDLMMTQAETQSLVKVKLAFLDETLLMCESHQASWQINMGHTHFTQVPGLYGHFIYSLNISGNALTEIQTELFTNMPNLKDLNLSSNKLASLPSDICKCTQLTTLSLGDNLLKELPSTLEHCKDIFRLDIDKNYFNEFPAVIVKLKHLKRLYAQFLHLQSLPDNFGDLSDLETLSLSGNCFTSLPHSFCKLQKLINLSLNGVMWMKPCNNILLSKEHFEEFLKTNNLHLWLNRHNKGKSAIFSLFDEDTNGTLDQKEIGKLNATMFHAFPRFGYMGKEPPNDDTPSGFPEVLCELKKLQYLSLQFHGIVTIPESINKLTNLYTLHLGNNPNLIAISAHAGSLPLKRIEIENCPRLKTPPKEITAKGFLATSAYLKRLLSGSVSCQRTKLMLVGLGGAGKSSLVKALLSENKKVKLSVEEDITDGIEICPWTVSTKEGNITYSVWDFAGQTVYYNTHQFFLSDRAVYLLTWNIRLGHEHAGLDFWLSSITVHAPNAPIFVVGTHVDQVSKGELPMREMQEKYPQICGFHFVSSHSGQGIDNLQEKLIEITLKQQYMGEKIPGVWLKFEESIKNIQGKSVILYKEVESQASRSGIFEKTEVIQAIQFLHELGSLQHFTNTNLKSHVVINPQWIVDVMACIVSVKDSAIKDGRLQHSDIAKVWKDYDPVLHNWMLKLTEEFDLSFPLKDEHVNLVPCLLPEKKPEFDWPEPEKGRDIKIIYVFDYLPVGLFNRVQVRLHQFCDSSLIWKRGSYLKKNGHVCLIYQSKESELIVKAHGPRPDNVLLLVHEVIETLILESFRGVTYDFYMPCPDCLNVAIKDPYMFAASTIRRATELKAPFLQCLKYFHIISITELHAIMPPDSNQDFDLQLIQAVRGMKELQQDLAADVFTSYCLADTEIKHEETVIPIKILEDVKKLGYKCWMQHIATTESTDEMARALIDAKIFMVFMSNNFVQDVGCCNLFKYARLTLHKPILLVAIGDNLNWKQSNMGILMADEVYINMMKASRYDSKFNELEAMLKDKHLVEKKDSMKKIFPPCFISYCWQNSAQAVAKGSKTSDGACGYGDPRVIKDFLESKDIKCWIDVERVGIHGLFEDIGEGLINCKVMVVCISDQYVASDNCATEFRFAANTLKIPIVLAVVGTGNRWRASELGIISLNYPLVSFQEKSSSAMDKLLELICSQLNANERSNDNMPTGNVDKKETDSSCEEQQKFSFQELCELAQRKFLRQVSQYAERLDPVPYPNIILLDICMDEKEQMETPEKERHMEKYVDKSQVGMVSSEQSIAENVTMVKSSGTRDFHDETFCAHLLCENEEGWHATGDRIVLSVNFGHTIEQYLPYLARVTTIAKYSKKLVLNCLASETGCAYLKWLEENPSVTMRTDFQESYGALRQVVQDADTAISMDRLERCLLPSGKYIWLCKTHRKSMRVTVLTEESPVSTVLRQSETMRVDYMLQGLQEIDVDLLPQQLKKAQEDMKNIKEESQAINESTITEIKSGESAAAAAVSLTNKDSPLLNKTSADSHSSETSEVDRLHSHAGCSQTDQRKNNQQRPVSGSNTKSKACRVM